MTSRQVQLKMQFKSTRKGDLETIESYVNKLKSIANSLAEIDSPISDLDMVLQLLAGLPIEYLPLKNTISSKWPLPTFEDACSMVYMQEDILLQDHEQSSGFCTKDTFYTVVDTVGVVVGAVGAVGTICAGVGALGTAAGAVITVNASRIIVGSAITAVAGWKIWQRK
uniref:Putative ovule protein n=1 Tax=Solanum chacoense TaxID=4108 RepID=A0A0V0HNG6_SOLCH